MEPGSVEDFAVGALLVTAMSFGIVLISAMIFRRFIALKSKPDRRALWSVLPGFLISASLVVPMLNEMGGLILAPLVAVGTGWIVFWMFRRDFRKAWIADGEELPGGVTLENDDWKVGIAGVGLFATVIAFRFFFRWLAS